MPTIKTNASGKVVLKGGKPSCGCCGCDPAALWGPGYDTRPDTLTVKNQTLYRTGSCKWQLEQCICDGAVLWSADCSSESDTSCQTYDFWVRIDGNFMDFQAPDGPEEAGPDEFGFYEYAGGGSYPYGNWSKTSGFGPATLTISP